MDEKHEAICLRDGECCRNKVIIDGKYAIMLDIYCGAWDPETKLCMIYDIRHTPTGFRLRGNRPCYSPEQAMKADIFPGHCPHCPPGYVGCHFSKSLLAKFKKRFWKEYNQMAYQAQLQRKVILDHVRRTK